MKPNHYGLDFYSYFWLETLSNFLFDYNSSKKIRCEKEVYYQGLFVFIFPIGIVQKFILIRNIAYKTEKCWFNCLFYYFNSRLFTIMNNIH